MRRVFSDRSEEYLQYVTFQVEKPLMHGGEYFWGVDLMEVPSAADKWGVVFDGHAVALVGYQMGPVFPGNGYFVFRNSWRENFGDHGYGYMPFDYVLKYANDLCVFSLPKV